MCGNSIKVHDLLVTETISFPLFISIREVQYKNKNSKIYAFIYHVNIFYAHRRFDQFQSTIYCKLKLITNVSSVQSIIHVIWRTLNFFVVLEKSQPPLLFPETLTRSRAWTSFVGSSDLVEPPAVDCKKSCSEHDGRDIVPSKFVGTRGATLIRRSFIVYRYTNGFP